MSESPEAQLVGTLLVSHPDLLPIIDNIREKYDIHEISPNDDALTELILKNRDDWEAIRQDIAQQLRNRPELLPEELVPVYNSMKIVANFPKPEEIVFEELVSEKLQSQIMALYTAYLRLMNLFKPLEFIVDGFYKDLENRILEFLITGKTGEAPHDWFGKVISGPALGSTIVVAMANELTDPKRIAKEFRAELTRVFGEDWPKITQGNLNTAEYLAMKLRRVKVKDIADEYIQRHPSEFPNDPVSGEYRAAKRKLEDRLKTNSLVVPHK